MEAEVEAAVEAEAEAAVDAAEAESLSTGTSSLCYRYETDIDEEVGFPATKRRRVSCSVKETPATMKAGSRAYHRATTLLPRGHSSLKEFDNWMVPVVAISWVEVRDMLL